MSSGLKILIIAGTTLLTCCIISLFFYFYKSGSSTTTTVQEYINKENAKILDNDVKTLDGTSIDGVSVLSMSSKYYRKIDVVLVNDFITKQIKTEDDLINNPLSIEYIKPGDTYNCKILKDENDVPIKLVFSKFAIGDTNIYDNSYVKMFTDSGEYTIPEGIDSITIYGCASGKGIYAGEYLKQGSSMGITLNRGVDYEEGDNISITLEYEGNTVIKIMKADVTSSVIANLQAGVIGDANNVSFRDVKFSDDQYSANGSVSNLGFQTGFDGEDGFSFNKDYDADSSRFTRMNLYKTSSDNITTASGVAAGQGGKGGFGGAYGFGGGGGMGAFIDTQSYISVGYNISFEDKVARGGKTTATTGGDGTISNYAMDVTIGKGGSGSSGSTLDIIRYPFKLAGGKGSNGSLTLAGAGGIMENINTLTLDDPSIEVDAIDATGNAIYSGKKNFTYISGASGGGAAGGYGAGGGEGGKGLTYTVGTGDAKKTITCADGKSGSPTGGMVLMYFNTSSEEIE